MIFRLRHALAGSPLYTAETGSLYYGLPVRFQLLSTPPRDDAVTFSYGVMAYSDRDFHPADELPLRAHEQQTQFVVPKLLSYRIFTTQGTGLRLTDASLNQALQCFDILAACNFLCRYAAG